MQNTSDSPQDQLTDFLAKYSPEIADQGVDALEKIRKLLPGATELVYDNYNALVIGFGPTERASEAVLSIALYPQWVTLFLLHGTTVRDPKGLLQGDGKMVRSIRLDGPSTLDEPDVLELIFEAVNQSCGPFTGSIPGTMIIKSISGKQRPRRPA